MNRKRSFYTLIPAMLIIMSALILGGCKTDFTHVGTTEELLDAIRPGAQIFMEPGYYNLSEYIENVWEQEGMKWNESHPYVKLEECYDGVEIVVENVDDLKITGYEKNPWHTELVVDSRYASIFNFNKCSNLELSFMTMGHAEQAYCAGNVLNFWECKDIELNNMDLYGCGVYGIGAYSGTEGLSVNRSIIRDCSDGPFDIVEGHGDFVFRDCSLTGSDGGGYFGMSYDAKLSFYNCSFGWVETESWYYDENIYKENCTWREAALCPDLSH